MGTIPTSITFRPVESAPEIAADFNICPEMRVSQPIAIVPFEPMYVPRLLAKLSVSSGFRYSLAIPRTPLVPNNDIYGLLLNNLSENCALRQNYSSTLIG